MMKINEVKDGQRFWFAKNGEKNSVEYIKLGEHHYGWEQVIYGVINKFFMEISNYDAEVIVKRNARDIFAELRMIASCGNNPSCHECKIEDLCTRENGDLNTYNKMLLDELEEIFNERG